MSGDQKNWTRHSGPKPGSDKAVRARAAMAEGYEVEQSRSVVKTSWGGKMLKGSEYDVEAPRLTGGK